MLSTACEKLPAQDERHPPGSADRRAKRAAPAVPDGPVATPTEVRTYQGPSETERKRAVGDVSKLTAIERAAYHASADFAVLEPPGPTDWLSIHPEPGQTFDEFRMSSGGNRVSEVRRTIYLQPIDELNRKSGPTLAELRDFTRAFYGLPVEVLPRRASSEMQRGSRAAPTGRQLLTTTVLSALRAQVPKDAYAVLGLTHNDLYPGPGWNFVFGQATFRERIGVHSLARYLPSFYGGSNRGAERLVRKRAYTVLAHEIGHMFGMHHCPYYHCIMNGSNGLGETDRTPLHLCPVCLRKLQLASGVDLRARHSGLAKHLNEVGLASSASWHRRRAQLLQRPLAENATARR